MAPIKDSELKLLVAAFTKRVALGPEQIDAVSCLDLERGGGRPMLSQMLFAEPIGQSWMQLSELALAFVLVRADRA